MKIYKKTIYNLDNGIKANDFIKKPIYNKIELPVLKSALAIKEKAKLGYKEAIGYINNHSNNQTQQNVIFICSSVIAANANKPIFRENFYNYISLFTARRSIKNTWVIHHDEYIKPNEDL